MLSHHLIEKILKIKLLILDIDGILTDGRIVYDSKGRELKFFDVQDGLGIVLLKRSGVKSAIMTAKRSRIVTRRAKDFNVKYVYQNCHDKLNTFQRLTKRLRLKTDEVCFMGDDVIDIPVLKRVGFAVTVPNAVDEAKEASHHITTKTGGRGAVREVCDLIIKTQGKWPDVMQPYIR